ALGPGALEGEARVRVLGFAEAEVAGLPPNPDPARRHAALNTLGVILHRVGRDRDAVDRLREGIAADGGRGKASDWLFLTLAYHGLGAPEEAAHGLARASGPATRPPGPSVWDTAEVEPLRREAAGLLLDAASPADPFAR